MKVLILCGGMGTRAYPYTRRLPKALMPVAGIPILEQVMRIYASQGFDEFVLAAGYLQNDIARYFTSRGCWNVDIVDTGDLTDTGGRVHQCLDRMGEHFHATYCDGLADIDLHALTAAHLERGGATMTTVRLPSQYGIIGVDADARVVDFVEKPVLPDYWINAGFFVFERDVLAGVVGDNLERHVLPALASSGRLTAYQHLGFWHSMDTFKDQQELDGLWSPHSARLDRQLDGARQAVLPEWLSERYAFVSEAI